MGKKKRRLAGENGAPVAGNGREAVRRLGAWRQHSETKEGEEKIRDG